MNAPISNNDKMIYEGAIHGIFAAIWSWSFQILFMQFMSSKFQISQQVKLCGELAQEKGASNWLAAVQHYQSKCINLNKSEFKDAMNMRYRIEL